MCGDSNLGIRQVRGEIDCKAPNKQLLRYKAMKILQSWPKHEFLHINQEWKQRPNRLASSVLQQETDTIATSDSEMQDLVSLNRLYELIVPEKADQVVKMAAINRSVLGRRRRPKVLREEVVQHIRIDRIKHSQEEGG